jgi:GT2 family glycosyltransferase/glycosyltransferase involved in cell wall biosynthesis
MKCDVIIPVYNAPDWVKLCVERLVAQTPDDCLNRIILIDDASNAFTADLLNGLAKEHNKIVLVRNEENVGFVKSINRGLALTEAPYILLLNSDCVITKNTIPKLITHAMQRDSVGLVSPVSNNSPVVSLEMVPGYSFIDMNDLVERLFPGVSFPACTIVGNCLLLTRACFEKTGLFDLCWGRGYGEETDYQFRAMQKGFEARIAIDSYVYHKSQASFADDPELAALHQKQYQLFMGKWGKEYRALSEQYSRNDPIDFMRENIKEYLQNSGYHPQYDVVYCLPGISQTVGGVHIVIDVINYLILKDITAGLVVVATGPDISPFYDKLFFNYLTYESLSDFLAAPIQTKSIVATCWNTVYACSLFASIKNIPLIYFIQGYEVAFRNGVNYGKTESTFVIADDIIVTSDWLHDKLFTHFGVDSRIITNGFDDAVFYPDSNRKTLDRPGTVTMVLRGSVEKGDWVLMDVIKDLLRDKHREINIYAVYFGELAFGESDGRLHPIRGPLTRHALSDLLRKSDIFVDASLHEGFGMFPLEAMACGAVAVVSDSGGVRQFIVDGQNGVIVDEVNKVERYVDAIKKLLDDPMYYQAMRNKATASLEAFSQESAFKKYVQYYRDVEFVTKKEIYKRLGAFHVQNMGLDTHGYVELYIDTGRGFHLGQSIQRTLNPKQGKMVFKLSEYAHIQNLRFDPLNGLVKVKIKGISVVSERDICFSVKELQSNAMFVEGNIFLFGLEDPQITFKIQEDCGKISKLIIDCEYLKKGREVYEEILNKCESKMNIYEVRMKEYEVKMDACEIKMNTQDAEMNSNDQDLIQLRKSLEQHQKTIQEIFQSRSWRITKPIRSLGRFFRPEVHRS